MLEPIRKHRPRTDVVVWKADGRPTRSTCYAEPITERLRRHGLSVAVMSYAQHAPDGELLKAPCHVLSGGDTPAASRQTWMLRARRALRVVLDRAAQNQASVVGICLGAQLIATALANRPVTRAAKAGLEVGISRVRPSDAPRPLRVPEFHYEEIEPRAVSAVGGRITHENSHSSVQGYRVGTSVRGYQFHPELDTEQLRELLAFQGELLERHRARSELAVLTLRRGVSRGLFDSLITEPIARQLGERQRRAA